MPKYLGISAIALGAMLTATAPSVAVSLNVGGDGPLVDLNSSTESDAVVDVDTDDGVSVDVNLDSTNDGALDLFGPGDAVVVDLNGDDTDGDIILDLGEDGDDVIVDLFGTGDDELPIADLTGDDLLDVNGDDDAVIDADLLNGGEDSVIIDLFGEPGGDATAEVILPNLDDGTGNLELLNDEILADLFGLAGDGSVGSFEDLGEVADIDSDGSVTTIDVLDETAVVTLGDGLDGDADLVGDDAATIDVGGERAAIALFDDSANVDLGGLDAPDVPGLDGAQAPSLGDLDVPKVDGIELPDVGQLLPDTADLGQAPIADGTLGDDTPTQVADSETSFGGDNSDSVAIGPNRARTGTALTARTSTRCFSPDEGQISHLISRRSYDPAAIAEWEGAGDIRVIAVQLCPAAKVRVSEVAYADANMSFLRAAVSADADIRAKLNLAGRDADDVLAVDKKGDNLVVYVY